jgi:hypothetical protein
VNLELTYLLALTDRDWVVKLHSLTSHSGLLGSPDSNEQQDPVFEVKGMTAAFP